MDVLGTGGCPDCGGSGPDLRIADADLSESSVEPGDDLQIDVTVRNYGDAEADGSRVRYYWSDDNDLDSSDDEVGSDGVGSLDPEEESDEDYTFVVPNSSPGTYYVLAAADADDEVDESDEDNNVESVSVTVGSGGSDLPNLIVDDVDSPSSVEAGDELDFDFVVAEVNGLSNAGGASSIPFDMEYYLLDGDERILIGDRTNPTGSLWPRDRDAGYNFKEFGGRADIPANLSPGTYEIEIEIDTDDEVDESDENDNDYTFSVQVEEGGNSNEPNLVVRSFDNVPTSVGAGETLRFDFVVAEINGLSNAGGASSVPFDMEYYLLDGDDRILVGDRTNPTGSLWPRDRDAGYNFKEFGGRADIPANLSPGTYEIVVEVDTDDEVSESDENDNDRSFFVEVTQLANLVVQSIDAPSTVEAGDELDFDFVVAELNGPADFEQTVRTVPFDMEYYLLDGSDRILVGDRTNPTDVLWPADREREYGGQAAIPASLAPGTYQIVVEVDTDDEVSESNEGRTALKRPDVT